MSPAQHQNSKRTVEQVVVGPEHDEQMLLGYQAKIDQCVHMHKSMKEEVERYEKHVAALLDGVPHAASSRDTRELQEAVDEKIALILHHCQLVQTATDKLASIVRENTNEDVLEAIDIHMLMWLKTRSITRC